MAEHCKYTTIENIFQVFYWREHMYLNRKPDWKRLFLSPVIQTYKLSYGPVAIENEWFVDTRLGSGGSVGWIVHDQGRRFAIHGFDFLEFFHWKFL